MKVSDVVAPRLSFMTPEVARTSVVFPPDRDRGAVNNVEASTLLHPRVLDAERRGWVGY